MIKQAIVLSAALMALSACKSSQTFDVLNPADVEQTGMVQIDASRVKPYDGKFRIVDAQGQEVGYQVLSNGDVIFLATIAPQATAQYKLENGNPAEVQPMVYGRMFPEHKDNMNWENDKSAYTAYGPALQQAGERGFGYDIWTKSVDTLVLESRYELTKEKKSLHKDHGNGMDAYIVANTLGGGTAALLDDNGDLIYPWAWKEYEVLENGPLRFSVKLVYNPAQIGEQEGVVETRVITLDAGSNLNRTKVSYEGLNAGRAIAPGIVIHQQNPEEYLMDLNNGILAYADSTDNPQNGNGVVYVGVIVPNEKADTVYFKPIQEPARDALGHVLAQSQYAPGEEFEYYWGSAWSKHPQGPQNIGEWMEYLNAYSECVANPFVVEFK